MTFVFAVGKSILKLIEEYGREKAHELEACLHCLLALLSNPSTAQAKLRLTIHIPTSDKHKYQQALPYVGDQRRQGGVGRTFPIHCGIVGKALREGKAYALDRKTVDTEEFIHELVKDYAYTDEDARKLDKSAQSWLAIPLLEPTGDGKGKVHGVLYADATVKGFFDEKRIALAMHAAVGMMAFVIERYNQKPNT